MMSRKVSKAILFGLPALVFLACSGETDGKSDNPEKAKDLGKPDITVTAKKILKEFEDNELAADKKYKGKVLKVTGKVEKVDTALLEDDTYVLNVNSGGDFEITSVSCEGAPKDQLADLTEGQKVTIVGEFDDGGDLGVTLTSCSVQ